MLSLEFLLFNPQTIFEIVAPNFGSQLIDFDKIVLIFPEIQPKYQHYLSSIPTMLTFSPRLSIPTMLECILPQTLRPLCSPALFQSRITLLLCGWLLPYWHGGADSAQTFQIALLGGICGGLGGFGGFSRFFSSNIAFFFPSLRARKLPLRVSEASTTKKERTVVSLLNGDQAINTPDQKNCRKLSFSEILIFNFQNFEFPTNMMKGTILNFQRTWSRGRFWKGVYLKRLSLLWPRRLFWGSWIMKLSWDGLWIATVLSFALLHTSSTLEIRWRAFRTPKILLDCLWSTIVDAPASCSRCSSVSPL